MNVFSKGALFLQTKLSCFLAEWCMQVYLNLHGSIVSGKHCTAQKCVNQRLFSELALIH
jgi:hypothetical protein